MYGSTNHSKGGCATRGVAAVPPSEATEPLLTPINSLRPGEILKIFYPHLFYSLMSDRNHPEVSYNSAYQ